MTKEKQFSSEYTQLFLSSLEWSLSEHKQINGNKLTFHGLPVEEWAGSGYVVGAMFDPYVLVAELEPSNIYLDWPQDELPGIELHEIRPSQKEQISFRINDQRFPVLYLPMIWGGVEYRRFSATGDWEIEATIAELPALVTTKGCAVFAFNPLRVIHRYLSMAAPTNTRDLIDLLVKAVLGASGIKCDLDDEDLRRDFHSLGVSSFLLGQMHNVAGKPWNIAEFLPDLHKASRAYMDGDKKHAKDILSELFKFFAQKRAQLVKVPVYIMPIPHGGILFEDEGYAEYDSPELAVRALTLYLDWHDRFGFRFAPDIGAGTLEELTKLYPQTMGRLRKAWDDGGIEFVNGTYSQPYMQLWHCWDQKKQFEVGLETFTKIFGRRPEVYAAQEIAYHPALPQILCKYGFKYAVHRSQNLGFVPIDNAPLINWLSPDGNGIRTLPSHPLRSELHGGQMCRHFPLMQLNSANDNLPFIVFTSLIDQTFIDLYLEEVVRANAYAPVWGEFVTPSEFFKMTENINATDTYYGLDEYHYDLDIASNSIHGHQTGGYSSEQAFIFSESARLQKLEKNGNLSEKELKRLLNQEAHDSYIIPYFATGYFMGDLLTDYNGPRYRFSNDLARGIDHFIRDAVGYPEIFSDYAPATPEPCVIDGTTMSSCGHTVRINPDLGMVVELDGIPCSLGLLKYDNASFAVENISPDGSKLVMSGILPGFGKMTLEYFFSNKRLYCEFAVTEQTVKWSMGRTCWNDCVYLEHAKPEPAEVVRTVSGVSQATELERFHSLDTLELRNAGYYIRLRHGGNIFFRQTETAVCNRLWCYDEFCDCFWWAVEL